MSNSLSQAGRRPRPWLAALLVLAVAAGIGFWWHSQRTAPGAPDAKRALRELRLDQLVSKDGRLYEPGKATPFEGRLYENFPTSEHFPTSNRKLEIEIHAGKAHGRSVGYFKDGKLEVEEFFIQGVSHGLRTRWSPEGWKKSEERIQQGKLDGPHVEWHSNGRKALEMTLVKGKPDGIAEAWHPAGYLKSRTRFEGGEIVEREFFPDGAQDTAVLETADPP
jgi:antitoxin component YwqK of YwqJK toxin-antitoxin module